MTRIVPDLDDAAALVDPRRAARQAKESPAPTVVLLVVALAAIQAFKTRALPTPQSAAALALAAVGFVLVATVAPGLVTYSLLLILLYSALTNSPVIEQMIARLTSSIRL